MIDSNKSTNYKIMVIDDDYDSRKEIYERFFTNYWSVTVSIDFFDNLGLTFSIIPVSTFSDLKECLKDIRPHAFFIDARLNTPDWMDGIPGFSGDRLEQTLQHIESVYNRSILLPPVFMVSGQWSEETIKITSTAFSTLRHASTPAGYYAYSDLQQAIASASTMQKNLKYNPKPLFNERKRIFDTIAKFHGRTIKKPYDENGEVVILHISDLQYHDRNTTSNTVGLFASIKTILDDLKKDKSISGVDLVVISGDITSYGKPHEFKAAEELQSNLFHMLWPNENIDEYRERIILVPGNHDYDINYCLLNYVDAFNIRGQRKIDFLSASEQLSESNRKKKNDYASCGLSAFKNFGYTITGDKNYLLNNSLNYTIDNFLDWGIRFVCLNTVYGIDAEKTNRSGVNKDELNSVINIAVDNNDDHICTIVVSHHSPILSNYDTESDEISSKEKEALQISFNALVNALGCKLFIGGHRHTSDSCDMMNSANKNYAVIEAASLRVEMKTNEEDSKDEINNSNGNRNLKGKYDRGLNIIILRKENGGYKEAIERRYKFDRKDAALTPSLGDNNQPAIIVHPLI